MFRKQIINPARGQAGDQPAASSRVGPWRLLSRRARSSCRRLAWSAPEARGDGGRGTWARRSSQRGRHFKQSDTLSSFLILPIASFLFCYFLLKIKGLLILLISLCLLTASQRRGVLRITPERSSARSQKLLTFLLSLPPCIPSYVINLYTSSHLPAPLSLYSFLAKLILWTAGHPFFCEFPFFSFSKFFKIFHQNLHILWAIIIIMIIIVTVLHYDYNCLQLVVEG